MRLIRAGGLLLSIAWCSCSAATAPDEHDTNRVSEEESISVLYKPLNGLYAPAMLLNLRIWTF
ncbi:hypothetical protein [Tannerella forsythia]|uniref:hypothetical protein n=1 Tax=Tannerella forsythia TaxID=28112 RepID=UPI0011806EFF|nr:hypothetical protein [Tannerella forsythia]